MLDYHAGVWRSGRFAFVELGKDPRLAWLQGIPIGQLEHRPDHPMQTDIPIHDIAGDVGGDVGKCLVLCVPVANGVSPSA